MFLFIPHYPKQFLKSFLQGKRNWPVQTKNKYGHYYTRFNIRAVEIFHQRDKYYEPCTDGILDNDEQIMKWIINKIGCKLPFWNFTSDMDLCSTQQEFQNTNIYLY